CANLQPGRLHWALILSSIADSTTSPASPSPRRGRAAHRERLAGHARIVGSGLAMAARLGVLAVVMLFALAMLTDMRHPFLDADEMSRMVAVLFCVVFIARMVAPYANGALVSFAAML